MLLDLPDALLQQVIQLSATRRGGDHLDTHQPLVSAARGGRDAVLENCARVRMSVGSQDSPSIIGPLRRMLKRVCTKARPGLELQLCGGNCNSRPHQDAVLAALLESGLSGWPNVRKLKLESWSTGAASGHLVGLAFPAITSLVLTDIHLSYASLLAGLAQCRQLTSITFDRCRLGPEGRAVSSAAFLKRLPALKDISLLWSMPLGVTYGLSHLTSLTLAFRPELLQQLVQVAVDMPELRMLVLDSEESVAQGSGCVEVTLLIKLLTSCKHLSDLSLMHRSLDQGGMDTLLTLGTHISHLTCKDIILSESRADVTCPWSHLSLQCEVPQNATALLAHLPLKKLQRFTINGQPPSYLSLPPSTMSSHQASLILSQAASNLASCPAWHCSTPAALSLIECRAEAVGGLDEEDPEWWADMPPLVDEDGNVVEEGPPAPELIAAVLAQVNGGAQLGDAGAGMGGGGGAGWGGIVPAGGGGGAPSLSPAFGSSLCPVWAHLDSDNQHPRPLLHSGTARGGSSGLCIGHLSQYT